VPNSAMIPRAITKPSPSAFGSRFFVASSRFMSKSSLTGMNGTKRRKSRNKNEKKLSVPRNSERSMSEGR
jgi:hypothetical protein